MLHCICGYTCGTQAALDRHIKKFADGEDADLHQKDNGFASTLPITKCKPLLCDVASPSSIVHSSSNSGSLSPLSPVTPLRIESASTTPICNHKRGSMFARAGTSALSISRQPSNASLTTASTSPGASAPRRVRIMIVRHAQSANKQRQRGQKASLDPELTDLGFEQAENLAIRLSRDFTADYLLRSVVAVVASPMRRCLLTIQPFVRKLGLGKDVCFCHGSFYEFGCAGKDRRYSTADDIVSEFQEFSPIGFDANGNWDYRGDSPKETETECKERCTRLAEWLHREGADLVLSRAKGKDIPSIILTIHQSLADLLCQILVEGHSDKWTYGDITHRISNTGITEVFLHADGRASFGMKNDDVHSLFTLRRNRCNSTAW
mmetsp:Transcript_24544/g.38483  ORF Transcript_24544/g.38483 Transcript_24544/m.38483 type:complete len:378 (+) Transcript_24544:2-1135(+)